MKANDQCYTCVNFCPGKELPPPHSTNWIRDWLGIRVDLNGMGKILSLPGMKC
jgi:hypothetical protein